MTSDMVARKRSHGHDNHEANPMDLINNEEEQATQKKPMIP